MAKGDMQLRILTALKSVALAGLALVPFMQASIANEYKARYLNVVDVRNFGANGNDQVDDTTAIQQAIDNSPAGTVLLFPHGSYLHGDLLTVGEGLELLSDGAELVATNDDRQSIRLNGNGSGILGFTLVSAAGKRGLSDDHHRIVVRGKDVLVAGNTIRGASGAGIFISGASDFVIQGNTVQDTLADGIHNTGGARDGLVAENVTRGTGDDGIAVVSYIKDDTLVEGIIIRHNTVDGNTHGRGISVIGGRGVEILENCINNTSAAGIIIASEKSFNTYAARDIRVIRNEVHNANYSVPVEHAGIFIHGRAGRALADGGQHFLSLRNHGVEVRGNTIVDTRHGRQSVLVHEPEYSDEITIEDNRDSARGIGSPCVELSGSE